MKQKGFAPILILVLIALAAVGYLGHKHLQSTNQQVNHLTTNSPNPTTGEGQFCGGIAGVICPESYSCKYDGNYPDASGICTKLTEQIPAITSQDLKQGWYWGFYDQKKSGTPANWIFTGNGSRSDCWHKPNTECLARPYSKYTCPQGGWADCMPSPNSPAKCSKEEMDWYKANCPDFKGGAY